MSAEIVNHPAAEDAAAAAIAEAQDQYRRAKARLEAYTREMVSSKTFKDAGNAIAWQMCMKILSGDLEPKSAKEAAEVAEKIVKMVDGRDVAAIGEAVNQIQDPEERRRTLAELRKTAQERALG